MKRIQTRAYNVKYRRYKEGKTDYKSRIKLLSSDKLRVVVRKGLSKIIIHFVNFDAKGDKTIAGTHSLELKKYNWKGHCGNAPSSYLTGYLCGLKAVKQNIKEAVLDLGTSRVVPKTNIFAAVLGLRDAGINLPCNENSLPSEDAVNGKAIAKYASNLDKDLYVKQFSAYIKKGFKPEDLPKNFEEVKKKIKEKW